MSAAAPRPRGGRTVAGFEQASWDLIVTAPLVRCRELLDRHGLAPGVSWHRDRRRLLAAAAELAADGEERWGAGGPVGNTLAAMAGGQLGRPRRLELRWLGAVGARDPALEPPHSPLDALRQVLVTPTPVGRTPRQRLAVCLVAAEGGEVVAIAVCEPTAAYDPPDRWPGSDVLVAAARDLADPALAVHVAGGRAGRLAVLLGDGLPPGGAALARLGELARRGRVGWVVGRLAEFRRCGLAAPGDLPGDLRAAGLPGTVELVATGGAAPVLVWEAAARAWHELPVPPRPAGGNDLGAGDAYAGAYLAARLEDGGVQAAHAAATAAAAAALQAPAARPDPEQDLNRVFGWMTGRRSDASDEGRLFDLVRRASGPVVVSGGQTGVDQLGLEAAAALGLPAFCVLPSGRRTETTEGLVAGHDEVHGAAVEELGSASYRYRTWTTGYLGDGTLLWDHHGSEGSAAARDACRELGRPWLDVARLPPGERLERVWGWAEANHVRVLTVAGNRGSLLDDALRGEVAAQLACLLRAITARRRAPPAAAVLPPAAPPVTAAPPIAAARQRCRLGVPDTPAHRDLAAGFLQAAYGLAQPPARRLVHDYPDPPLTLVLARPRDLPALLADGALQLALLSSELLRPGQDELVALLDTGLFPLLVGLVGRDRGGAAGPVARWLHDGRVGGQDLDLARRLLARFGYHGPVRPINGTAEAWIGCGALDLAVDTWSTGATARANGLSLLRALDEATLVLAAHGRPPLPDTAARLAADLHAWLTGTLVGSGAQAT